MTITIINPLKKSRATAGFCTEIKSTGTNGPLSLKKVGNFKKYAAQNDAKSLSAFKQVEKT